MFKNYLHIAYRNIINMRAYTILNISGLALGMASFILIFIFVVDEYSYDRFHAHSDRIYRLVNVYDKEGVGERSASSPFPMAAAIKEEFPEYVEEIVRFFNFQQESILVNADSAYYQENGLFFTDPSVFKVFNIAAVEGNIQNFLVEPNTIILSETIAKKYFGEQNPIGKTVKIMGDKELIVNGIFADFPKQSHIPITILANINIYYGEEKEYISWFWNPCWTYLLLRKDVDYKHVEELFPHFIKKYMKDAKGAFSLYLQPLHDIHLYSKLDYEIKQNSNGVYVKILSIVGFLILIIAAINFTNLATASSARRAKEIGMKKVIGAQRNQLIFQFLLESCLVSFTALVIALSLVEFVLPFFRDVLDKEFPIAFRYQWKIVLPLIALGLFTGILSGFYPAFYLSSLKPIVVLKKKYVLKNKKYISARFLVVLQFSISIALIFISIGIFRQFNYLQTANLGFQRDNILLIDISTVGANEKFLSIKEKILQHSDIEYVTGMRYVIGTEYNTYNFKLEDNENEYSDLFPAIIIEKDFFKTFDIKLLQKIDSIEKYKGERIYINEKMIEYLEWGSNENAVRKHFISGIDNKIPIVGVISNFNIASLHHPVGPFMLIERDWSHDFIYIAVRFNSNKIDAVIEHLENVWNSYVSKTPFSYTFMKDELNKMYEEEAWLSLLTVIFTVISIIISCLGIYGLTSFVTEQRTREIGIRKAIGAGISEIIKLLIKEYLILIFIAGFVALPVSLYVLHLWLNSFAFHIEIKVIDFVSAFCLAMIISLFAAGIKAWQAAKANPINSLRYE